jgi:hypothetical protein
MRGGLGPALIRVDDLLPALHDVVVDPILDIGCRVGSAEESLVVGIVFGKQQPRSSLAKRRE